VTLIPTATIKADRARRTRRVGALLAASLLLSLAVGLRASDWAVGPRAALGWSQDTGDDSYSFVPEMTYGGGVQVERSLGKHAFAAFEVAYDQAGRRAVGTLQNGPGLYDYEDRLIEDEVGEALLAGGRVDALQGRLHPRAYLGYQFTQALDERQNVSGGGMPGFQSLLYPNQDHRYRSFGVLGLGLGLGRSDSVILDFRASQELEHQIGFVGAPVYAKFQFGLTWLYRI
jgi:hypothetical protein